uniref:Uncharacterized protein n=1 Tax=Siphoviridae sp. ct2u94 TaxID=2826277 RepID=A0A8S5QWL4_9CAUD|nr:MAG TPA: hypothetical protein [Siphoviridae sp. ct2u94]
MIAPVNYCLSKQCFHSETHPSINQANAYAFFLTAPKSLSKSPESVIFFFCASLVYAFSYYFFANTYCYG